MISSAAAIFTQNPHKDTCKYGIQITLSPSGYHKTTSLANFLTTANSVQSLNPNKRFGQLEHAQPTVKYQRPYQ